MNESAHKIHGRFPLVMEDVRLACFFSVEREDALRLRESMASDLETYVVDTILHWRSNDAVVGPSVYSDAAVECPKVQLEAYQKYIGEKLKGLRKPHVREDVDAEMSYELDAAFGAGVPVVNVLTGRRIR